MLKAAAAKPGASAATKAAAKAAAKKAAAPAKRKTASAKRKSNPTKAKAKAKSSLKVKTIKSRHGESYKFEVSGGGLKATTLTYNRDLEDCTWRTAHAITPTVNRTDSHKKPPATYNMRRRVVDAVFEAMQALEPRRKNPSRLAGGGDNPRAARRTPASRIKPGDTLHIEAWTGSKFVSRRLKAKRVTKTFVELHDGAKFRLKPTQERDAFTEIDNSSTWQASPAYITAVNGKSI